MIARGVRKVDESRDRRGIQSGRILKYWTEVICWYVFRDMVLASLIRVETMSKNGENADTISRLDLRVSCLPRSKLSEMDLLIEERVKFEHVCAISLSKNFGLRLLLLLDGVLRLSITYDTWLEDLEQLPDRAYSNNSISLSWICITSNRSSSIFGYSVIPLSAGI